MITFSNCKDKAFQQITSTDGTIDLTNWDFSTKGAVALDGNWDFYWNQFLSYQEILELANNTKNNQFIQIPGNWKDMKLGKSILAGDGFCTIHLRVKVLAGTNDMAIRIPVIGTANKVWIDDKLIFVKTRARFSLDCFV